MIGGDLSKYLINFNSSEWANQANSHLQNALQQGLKYSEDYTKQAGQAVQDYSNQAQNQIKQGFGQAQALNTPQHLATYNALDAYTNNLGLPSPAGGSYQLAQNLNNSALGLAQQPQPGGNVPQPGGNMPQPGGNVPQPSLFQNHSMAMPAWTPEQLGLTQPNIQGQ